MSEGIEEPVVYAVRLTARAVREIGDARVRLAGLTDDETANAWEAGLVEAMGKLATFPNSHPFAPESRRFTGLTIRQMLYRRASTSSMVYRVVFAVYDESEDGPTVYVFHVRHASRRPIAATEARQLREELQG